MKNINLSKLLMIVVIIIMPTVSLFSQEGFNSKKPHNGVIKRAKGFRFECITKESKLYFFVFDKKMNQLPNTEITGTASIVLTNGETKKVDLIKSGADGFMINETNVTNYYSMDVTFKIGEKSITVTFYKERKLEHFKEDKTKHYHEQGTQHNYN